MGPGTRSARVAALMGAVAALVVACGTDGGPSTPSTSSTPPPTAQPVDPANCTEKPPQGDIDRSGQGFLFQDGSIDIAVTRPSDTSGRGPGAGVTPTDATTCYEFERWGPAQPDVPPDSLLFVFKDAGAGGAQIEFLISELTGGLLPPVGGARPTVGPLTKPVNAQIGVSVDGVYHHSSTCQLSVTAMSDQLAAGSFSCPTATRVDANPLAPDDDVSYDIDESSTKKPAPTSGPTAGVSLSGWFELRP